MECSICCEKFNKSNHLRVECKGCEEPSSACRKCCQTFILSTSNDPMCMFCKTPWDRDFMNENLTQKFVNNELKLHTENTFMERQISLLPETQKAARNMRKILECSKNMEEAESELNRIKAQLYEQKELIKSYKLQIYRLRMGEDQEESSKKENFTHKCSTINCNGFLDSRYFCSLCDTKFCRHCLEIKEEDHECNEETKATIQAIKKEAKPCPGCGEMISKIDGCDQMWCIKCHIQFSWRTGQQMSGHNHNPEYFRWMRETGQQIARNPEEAPQNLICGEVCNGRVITTIITNIFPNSPQIVGFFQHFYAFYRHTQYKLEGLGRDENLEVELKTLRIKYLLKTISAEQWKKTLQQLDKKSKKEKSYKNVWRLIETVLRAYVEEIVTIRNETGCRERFIGMIKEANDFKLYINESFIKISNTFGSQTCPGVGEDWREIYNYKDFLKRNSKNN
jgi:hypothetical protein